MKRNSYDIYDLQPDARIDTWIWLRHRKEKKGEMVCDFSDISSLNFIHEVGGDNFLRLRDFEHEKHLLPTEAFSWIIKKDKRQSKWILAYIESELKCGIFDCPPRLEGKNRIVASLDAWECDLSEKDVAVKNMELAWYKNRREDEVFDWFKEEEASRVQFAWKWLVRKALVNDFKGAPFSKLEDILAFYDEIDASLYRKEGDVDDIKKSWSLDKHKKKRKAEGKSQCNVWIRNEIIIKLDSLCDKFDLSRADVFEALIEREFATEECLRGKG